MLQVQGQMKGNISEACLLVVDHCAILSLQNLKLKCSIIDTM